MFSFSTLREGFWVQISVIKALMLRELVTRFGRENIGFLWIMVEPLLFAGIVAAIWRFMKGPEENGVSMIAFVVTGYIPITLFRHCVGRSVAAFTSNSGLLYHRQIKIEDFIITRFAVEFLGSLMAYLFIAVILILFDVLPVPADIGLFLSGWMLYSLFTFSLCLVIAPLSEMSEVLEKFIPVTTYVMVPFSGLFNMASSLTPSVREYFLLSPFVNGMEMMRKGIWGEKMTAYYNIWNPIECSIVLTAIGLVLCRHVRRSLTIA